MPAKSKHQQRFFGMVHQCQKTGKCASPEVKKVANSISYDDADDFASTKHKGLPAKVEGYHFPTFLEFMETAGDPAQQLYQLAAQLGGAYPNIIKYMIGKNPHRVGTWASTITTPQALEQKVAGWRANGLIGSDEEIGQKVNRDGAGEMRLRAANNDPAVWFRMLDEKQKGDIKAIAFQAKRGNAIRPPVWISRGELPLFNQVIDAGWF